MQADILIISATALEISHFLKLFPYQNQIKTKTGLTLFSGGLNEKRYDLLITGPGVFNTSHALTAYLEQNNPQLIIQMGIAGIFEQSTLTIGDISVATRSHYIHTGIETVSFTKDPLPFDLIPSDPLSREGIYTHDPKLVDHFYLKVKKGFQRDKIQVGKGPIISVSCITGSKSQADKLYAAYSPLMEAMEGAASAHVAALYKIPVIEIRSASNYVGERDKSKWDIDTAVKNIGMCIPFLNS